ncbi:MAG: acetyl-coenzyme A synthetase N-terminal domain-containing protein, partial [Bacteroidota bacterium]
MHYLSKHKENLEQPEVFWREQAKEIDWFTFPPSILSKDEEGLHRWYAGGKMNTSYLALDYHVNNGRADQLA